MYYYSLPGSGELCCAAGPVPAIRAETPRAQEHRCTRPALAGPARCGPALRPPPRSITLTPGRFAPLCFRGQAGAKPDFKGFALILFDVAKASQAGESSASPLGSRSVPLCPSGRRLRPQGPARADRCAGRQLPPLRQQRVRCPSSRLLSGSELCPPLPPSHPAPILPRVPPLLLPSPVRTGGGKPPGANPGRGASLHSPFNK